MMNLKKSPGSNAYKYAFVVLLAAASYFLINPLSATASHKNAMETAQDLKKFEGYYEIKGQNGSFIQISATGKGLILKQLWDNRQIDFTATAPLKFSTKANPLFTLAFTSDDAGHITQVLAFGRDLWIRSDNYHAPVEVKLPAQDLKKFEGYYEMKDHKDAFIQISSTGSGLILKQLWDYRQVDFAATNPLNFFAKKTPGFTLQFTSDNAGHITQVLGFGKDVWIRNDNYHPPVEIKITAQDLKKFEGKYELKTKKGTFIQITSADNGLVLKQLWDGKQIDFAATSELDFFAKTAPGFTLKFTGNNSGGITRVLAFGQDVWDKTN